MSEDQSASTITDTQAAIAAQAEVDAENHFHTAGVLTISAGHAVHDTFTGFLNPLLPTFIQNLSMSTAQAGLLTVFMQWPSLFQPILGHIADRVSLRPFFIMAPTVTAVAMSLLGVAPSYAVMAMMLLVAGISSASIHAAGPAVIGHLSGKKLGRGMGWWMVGGELGRTLGPLTVVTAVQLIGLRGTPWLMIAGPITSVLLYYQLRNVSDIKRKDPEPIEWRSLTRSIGVFMLPLMLIIVVRDFINASLATYLPILLSEQGSSLWLAGASLSVYQAAGVFGALLGGTLSDRLGRRIILFVAMGVTSVAIFLFIYRADTIWLQLPLLLILGFFSLSITPVFMAMVQEHFPENRALATGVYQSINFLIRSGIVVLLGVLADRHGMRVAFIISGLSSLLGLPLILLLPKGVKKQQA
ncbi:MAG: MFS transporter [Anaerolineae bacterium]|nr:MFS transporter [Anaerolineae bacterium]